MLSTPPPPPPSPPPPLLPSDIVAIEGAAVEPRGRASFLSLSSGDEPEPVPVPSSLGDPYPSAGSGKMCSCRHSGQLQEGPSAAL